MQSIKGHVLSNFALSYDLTVVTDKPPSHAFMDVFVERDITLITHQPGS
jgi:hypothetical protein